MHTTTELVRDDQVILTGEDIRRWQARYVEIDDEIAVAQRRIEELTQERRDNEEKLKAAAMFSSSVREWLSQQVPPADEIALTDAILKLLRGRAPNPMARDRIKAKLPAMGYPENKLASNPNYLYVALKRLRDRGEIVEEGEGAYRITT